MDQRINFTVGKENIIGEIISYKSNQLPNFVFLHGAGTSSKERAKAFFDQSLFDSVPGVLTFDFSGHGESSGELKNSSLQQRVQEAKTAIERYSSLDNLTICGTSMGGYIALKMLSFFKIKNLILFAPALYDKKAYTMHFDENFTRVLREPKSWQNTDIFEPLEKFSGNLLIFIGDEDQVIPKGVIDLLDTHSPNVANKEIIQLHNCPHLIYSWLTEHPAEKSQITKKVLRFINDSTPSRSNN